MLQTRCSSLAGRRAGCRTWGGCRQATVVVAAYGAAGAGGRARFVDVEEGKKLLDQSGYKFLDVRSKSEYEREHLTKPPRACFNVPHQPESDFAARVARQLPSTATKMLVVCSDGGEASSRAVQQLEAAGYNEALGVEGGYQAWTKVFTTSGRRRPPPGRWVSSGREALKSGLNIPGVAESYDEGGNLINARYAKGYKSPQQLQEELEKLSSDRAAAAAAATASSSSAATSSSSLSSAASSWRRPQEPQQLEQPARSQSRQAQPAAQTQRLRASWREALAAEVEGGADSDGGQAEAAAPKKYSAWR
ncbi:hypothetical protein CHLRE_16g663150v5 [Chlamydomonas reinhardtii]|uniref:Uncharacterized protein n=1 Tax=Chlamydomonas reinhardtii TaxID=3055 RepID=A8J8T6_CHLRE|nr:uncharacterized protein CHLRE_16g663150v5 [Chlamydomonas reinhardtii]PNW71648.1 hypothetical protein CHLRE_16g663150v5 [Chlamydomonas reinhardtii]|eukprot:XP_001697960.1 predicted protein [Chlamydomonas reinhardtii]